MQVIEKKPKRPYTKRTPAAPGIPKFPERALEELEKLPWDALTRGELERILEQTRDDLMLAQNKNKEYAQGYENLFKENNNLKNAYQNLKIAATQQVTFFKEQISMLYRTALLIKNLED